MEGNHKIVLVFMWFMMTDECTSNLLDLLQLANGTVLHFNYEQILFYKLYYCGYSYYILYDSKRSVWKY